MGETDSVSEDADNGDAGAGRKRDRSKIEFPYSDLERSVELASILLREGGQAHIDQVQLAVAMDQSATGGTFRGRLGAARMFGLIETEHGKVKLTSLGLSVTDDRESAAAKVTAFLNIPLYNAMFEKYQGYALPPAAAIERQMESLGVPPKQKERARQAFSASAQFAGYIASNGRFSKPAPAAPSGDAPPKDGSGGGGEGGGNDGENGDRGDIGGGQKELEYQLIDLMTEPDIDDDVKASIWSLVQYLTSRKKKKAAVPK